MVVVGFEFPKGIVNVSSGLSPLTVIRWGDPAGAPETSSFEDLIFDHWDTASGVALRDWRCDIPLKILTNAYDHRFYVGVDSSRYRVRAPSGGALLKVSYKAGTADLSTNLSTGIGK